MSRELKVYSVVWRRPFRDRRFWFSNKREAEKFMHDPFYRGVELEGVITHVVVGQKGLASLMNFWANETTE